MQIKPDFTLPKAEKLCHEVAIKELFTKGESAFLFPFKLIFKRKTLLDAIPTQVVFSVSKRNFKLATDRNWIKRRLRELYRLHKNLFFDKQGIPCLQHLGIVYVAKEKIEYAQLKKKFVAASKKIITT